MKQKIILMRGLPGSGKSTKARWLVSEKPGTYMRINRDDLRQMAGERSHKIVEKMARRMRDSLVINALENGLIPIIDDTNIDIEDKKSHFRNLIVQWDQKLFNGNGGFDDHYEFEVIDLTHVSVEECIKRDRIRGESVEHGRSVGEKVIKRMARQLQSDTATIAYDPLKEDVIVTDLDGTLAIINGRSPYSQNEYFKDMPRTELIAVLNKLAEKYKVIIVSGRQGTPEVIQQTTDWLNTNNVHYSEMYTRAADDPHRQDALVKLEILHEKLLPKYNIIMWYDDRQRVVDAIRDAGILVSQVAPGDF